MALSIVNDIRHRCCCRPKDVTELESSCDKSGLHSWCLHHLLLLYHTSANHLVRRRLQVANTVIKVPKKNGFWPNPKS
jgi:hypothetical protein